MSIQTEEFRSPQSFLLEQPLPNPSFLEKSRLQLIDIHEGKDPRFAIILGPCSIDDPLAALDYAKRVASLQKEIESQFYLIMRVYLEKPRTSLGWTGFLTEPKQTFDPLSGIREGRKLLCAINRMDVPIATEFVSPFTAPYISDLITWGSIGARTSCSVIHRQLAATLPMPIGFKNTIEGCFNGAINGITCAKAPQTVMGIGPQGTLSLIHTDGNPHCHLVLRGGTFTGPNYDIPSLKLALTKLEQHGLPDRLIVDCSHHNSGKNHLKQIEVFERLMRYKEQGISSIFGCMLESYLMSGSQTEPIRYGQSLTDPCLGWDETRKLLLHFAKCAV